jgi:hypothetical protein
MLASPTLLTPKPMTETDFRSYFLNMSAIISDSGIRVNPIIHVGGLQFKY